MAEPVRFAEPMEAAVRRVEETPPDAIVAATIARLKAGESPASLLAAAALAVSRSTELPPDHHGGPIHPVSGVHAVYRMAQRLPGDWALMPIVQNVALANKHIHAPDMGPWIMPALNGAQTNGATASGASANDAPDPQAFTDAIEGLHPTLAERALPGLVASHGPGELLDLMLREALRRNALDDHYFLYPLFATRALDCIGWEWASVLLRTPVRYLATNARALASPHTEKEGEIVGRVRSYEGFAAVEALLDSYALMDTDLRERTGDDEDQPVGALGARLGAVSTLSDIAEPLAEALAAGLSLEGAGEALSIAAGLLHLRSNSGNPFDVHLHTGVNARRHLLRLKGVSRRHKLLALLGWTTGPEVWFHEGRLVWPAQDGPGTADALRPGADAESDSPGALLDTLCAAIAERRSADALAAADGHVDWIVLGPEARPVLALARRYADAGFDAATYFARLGAVICRDDFSEMHALKHNQAVVEEYATTRAPYRWVHLVSAAKVALCTHGLTDTVYRQAQRHLAV